MFGTLEIYNFQSHNKTEIDFSPHVNIITGSSNSGKTAILRALNWVINNRPLGTSFIRKGQDKTKIVLFVDEKGRKIGISRFRDNIDNYYAIAAENTDARFEAIGSNVPKEISDVLNFSDINIQEQLSPYFLVLDSPGKIALFLNSITHLNEVDEIVSLLSSKLRVVEHETVGLEEQLVVIQKELDEIIKLDLEGFEEDLRIANRFLKEIDELKSSCVQLSSLITQIDILEKGLTKIPTNINQLKDEVDKVYSKYQEKEKECGNLRDIVLLLQKIDERLVGLPFNINQLKNEATQILERYVNIVRDTKELLLLQEALEKVQTNINEIVLLFEDRKVLEQTLLSELKSCPLCGQVLTEVAKGKILENYE